MREFCLKVIIREEFRTRVECGKFFRLWYVRILFAYVSKTVSKSIHIKRYRGLNLLPLHLKTGNKILAKASWKVLTERALKRILVIVKATVLLQWFVLLSIN